MVVSLEMCYFCFDVLYCHLNKLEPPKNPGFTDDEYPLFVTWKIGREFLLRGCIGTFTPMNLYIGLRKYATSSAFKDHRFSPIAPKEFSSLHVSVSILHHFENVENYLAWIVGIHGIQIGFMTENGAYRTATYLPEIASDQGWDHIQTIDALLRKGGYKAEITPEVRNSIHLTRYLSEKMTVSYQDYMDDWFNQHSLDEDSD